MELNEIIECLQNDTIVTGVTSYGRIYTGVIDEVDRETQTCNLKVSAGKSGVGAEMFSTVCVAWDTLVP